MSVTPESIAGEQRPDPPAGALNLVVVILDSLRYDSWVEAQPRTLAALGEVERRWSYASWTAPSHYNLLMGLLPHTSPPEVYASEYYKQDFLRYSERLGLPDIEFKRLLPALFLPTYLKHSLGYRTHARVSMPVLNEYTAINRDFDSYRLMPKHNDMAAMLDDLQFSEDAPSSTRARAASVTHRNRSRGLRLSVSWPWRSVSSSTCSSKPRAKPLGSLSQRLALTAAVA